VAINIWRRFEKLIKPAAEEVVTITAVNTDGTVTAETMAGAVMRIRCGIDVEVGDQVFVAAGEVKSIAPALTYYELDV
jgi:hypothetical protein